MFKTQPAKFGGSKKLVVARNFTQKFSTKHILRVGAIIWIKSKGKDYYTVFKSFSRPNRGIQLPGGRVERNENPGYGIVREVIEETGIKCRIICPLGLAYYENPTDTYSNLQLYYILRPLKHISPFRRWHHIDKDQTHQELECWFEEVEKDPSFLSIGQDQMIYMFREWLQEHKKKRSK